MASKRDLVVIHGSGQTWELNVPSEKMDSHRAFHDWLNDKKAEHDYWNYQTLLKNERDRRMALKMTDDEISEEIVASMREHEAKGRDRA